MRWDVDSDPQLPSFLLGQEMARNGPSNISWLQALSMTLMHCPLCLGLALLSAIRTTAHLVMIAQLERRIAEKFEHPASLLGAVFEL